MPQNRRLAAILFTDIVGSSAIMQKDEHKAVSISNHYAAVLKQAVPSRGGEVLNDFGDGSLCCFASATDAVLCAMDMQHALQQEPKVPLRIGIHVGEIFFNEVKVFGDGVNIASRVQSLGIANSILISSEIYNKIKNQPEFQCTSIGLFRFKNIDEPVEVFALANQGLCVPDRKRIEGKLQQTNSSRKIWIALGLVAILGLLSLFLFRHNLQRAVNVGKEKSIAILPFQTIGTSSDNIGEGLVEDILGYLSKISELKKVISNRSSCKYSNSTQSTAEIGQELGVNSLVTGSIEQLGDRIRVRAQLIDCESGATLWAENYTSKKKQIFDLEPEVAGRIVNALKIKLTAQEVKGLSKRYTDNVEAYRFYLKGRSFWNKLGRDAIDSAEANFQRALDIDPDYALAYAGLADCHVFNFKGLSQLDEVPIAKMYIQKALALDGTLSEALTTLGFIQQNFDFAWAASKGSLEKAIDLDPNNFAAHMNYGLVIMHSTDHKDVALGELRKAVDLNPLAYVTNWQLARNYFFAGKNDSALYQFRKTATFASHAQKNIPNLFMGLVYLKMGRLEEAKSIFDHLPPGDSAQIDNFPVIQSYGEAIMGDKTKAKALLENTMQKYPNLSHYRISQVYVALGQYNEAVRHLELGYMARDVHMFWIKVDPGFDPIRNLPSFTRLLQKMHLY
jgi:adenylate cyclase